MEETIKVDISDKGLNFTPISILKVSSDMRISSLSDTMKYIEKNLTTIICIVRFD